VGPTPLLDSSRVYLNNPVSSSVVALNLMTGAIQWQTPVTTPAGRFSWGPGVLIKGDKLIQPVGPTLYTLNATTGVVLNQHTT
jgi:outer membrane protein assembly factor BamB